MVLLEKEQFDLAYKQVKTDALKGGCTVLILVAPDADAMASCRILT